MVYSKTECFSLNFQGFIQNPRILSSELKNFVLNSRFFLKTQGFSLKTQGFSLETQEFPLKTQGIGTPEPKGGVQKKSLS